MSNADADDWAGAPKGNAEPFGTQSPGRSASARNFFIAGSVAAAVALTVGALMISAPREAGTPTAAPAASFDMDGFPTSSGTGAADFVILSSPAELAASARLIVQGTIREVVEADIPPEIPDAWGSAHTVVIVVDVTAVRKGDLDPRSDGTVHLVLPGYRVSDEGTTLAEWNTLLLAGTDIVAYPDRAWVHDWGFGNVPPAGADLTEDPLYLQFHPQGLAVHVPGSDSVAWPLVGDEKVGTFQDALPGGKLIGDFR
jgi:hypothetical protein